MRLSATISNRAVLILLAPLLAGATGEVEMLTEELPWAVIDRVYSPPPLDVRVTGRCPAGGVGFAVVSGALPPGLKLSRLGYFSGVPTRYGLFEFNVRVVNGCSWAARHFALLVTEPPKLKVVSEPVTVSCPRGVNPPPIAIRLTATWPQLTYAVTVTSKSGGAIDWLTASPEHGATSRESTPRKLNEIPEDQIWLHFNVTGLKPGQYVAQVSISAWQAEPIAAAVTFNVEEFAPEKPEGESSN